MERTNDIPSKKALTAVCLALVASAGWANDGRELRFQGTVQATSKIELPPAGEHRCKSKGHPTLRAQGAGDTNLFGSVYIEQSHCVGDRGAFTDGVFKLSRMPPPLPPAHRALVEGVYCGTLVPTFNSTFLPTTPPTPQGTWLIAGYVCIKKTTLGEVEGDCGQPAHCSAQSRRYQPARGITNVTIGLDGPATIFIDQVLRLK